MSPFSTIAAELEAEQERVTQMLAEAGPNTELTVYAPLSGDVFTWDRKAPQAEDRD